MCPRDGVPYPGPLHAGLALWCPACRTTYVVTRDGDAWCPACRTEPPAGAAFVATRPSPPYARSAGLARDRRR